MKIELNIETEEKGAEDLNHGPVRRRVVGRRRLIRRKRDKMKAGLRQKSF